jgi:hypothetical protein
MSECIPCPKNTWSVNTTKESVEDCYCMVGYYTRKQRTGTACHLCEFAVNNDESACPLDMVLKGEVKEECIGGICKGGLHWPVAKPGSYLQYEGEISNGDRFPSFFWCPLREACLGENVCLPGHKGLKCAECEAFHYQQRSGSISRRKKTPSGGIESDVSISPCKPCGADSLNGLLVILGIIGVFVILQTIVLLELLNYKVDKDGRGEHYDKFRACLVKCLCLPCVMCCSRREAARHQHHHDHMHPKKKKKKGGYYKAMAMIMYMYPDDAIDMVEEIEWDALYMQLMNAAHVIYGISLNAIEWPPVTYYILEVYNYISFALDRFPIACVLDIPFHISWMVLTSLPYVIAFSFTIIYVLKVTQTCTCHGKELAKEQISHIPIPIMQVLVFVFFAFVMWHIQLILQPFACIPCGDPGNM